MPAKQFLYHFWQGGGRYYIFKTYFCLKEFMIIFCLHKTAILLLLSLEIWNLSGSIHQFFRYQKDINNRWVITYDNKFQSKKNNLSLKIGEDVDLCWIFLLLRWLTLESKLFQVTAKVKKEKKRICRKSFYLEITFGHISVRKDFCSKELYWLTNKI